MESSLDKFLIFENNKEQSFIVPKGYVLYLIEAKIDNTLQTVSITFDNDFKKYCYQNFSKYDYGSPIRQFTDVCNNVIIAENKDVSIKIKTISSADEVLIFHLSSIEKYSFLLNKERFVDVVDGEDPMIPRYYHNGSVLYWF